MERATVYFFEKIGLSTVKNLSGIRQSFLFTLAVLKVIFSPSSYTIASVEVLVRQVYFTAIQILPFYLILAIVVGSTVVGVIMTIAISFGFQDKIGSIIVNVLINEMAPFITVLLLALRSGTAMTTEMAVMNVSGEMRSLKYFNINPVQYLFAPRILNGILSMFLLSTMFTFVALISGYLFLALVLNMGLSLYIHTIVDAFGAMDLLILLLKSLFFGYIVTAIPVYRGNKTLMTYNAIPIAVLKGMVKLFVAILLIEVLSFIRFL